MKTNTSPPGCTHAGVPDVETRAVGTVEARISEAFVDRRRRHAGVADIVRLGDPLAVGDRRRAGTVRPSGTRALEARRRTAVRLKVASRTGKTRSQARLRHVPLFAFLYRYKKRQNYYLYETADDDVRILK